MRHRGRYNMELRPIQLESIKNIYDSFKKGGTYHLVQASVALLLLRDYCFAYNS